VAVPVVITPIVLAWVLVSVPRHFALLSRDKRFARLFWEPFLSLRCSFAALKPTSAETKKYPWILMTYYFSLILPIICFIILITYTIGKRKMHGA
jgi:hypothetical protein